MVGTANKTAFYLSVSVWLCIIVIRTRPLLFDRSCHSKLLLLAFQLLANLSNWIKNTKNLGYVIANTTTGYVIAPEASKLL